MSTIKIQDIVNIICAHPKTIIKNSVSENISGVFNSHTFVITMRRTNQSN